MGLCATFLCRSGPFVSRLGRGPLKAEIRVRFSYGLPNPRRASFAWPRPRTRPSQGGLLSARLRRGAPQRRATSSILVWATNSFPNLESGCAGSGGRGRSDTPGIPASGVEGGRVRGGWRRGRRAGARACDQASLRCRGPRSDASTRRRAPPIAELRRRGQRLPSGSSRPVSVDDRVRGLQAGGTITWSSRSTSQNCLRGSRRSCGGGRPRRSPPGSPSATCRSIC